MCAYYTMLYYYITLFRSYIDGKGLRTLNTLAEDLGSRHIRDNSEPPITPVLRDPTLF